MGIVDGIKAGASLAKQIGNTEVYELLIDAQRDSLDQLDDLRSLKNRVAELEDQLKTKGSLRFRDNFYWLAGEDKEEGDGPFCSRCKDKEEKLVRLHGFGRDYFGHDYFGCPGCGLVRDKKGGPAHQSVVEHFNLDRAMGRPSGGRR